VTQSRNRISQTLLLQWRSILPLKLFNVGDSTTSSGRPFHMLTIRKPKKFALSFVLQYLFWIFKQCPLVSNVLRGWAQKTNGRFEIPGDVDLVWCFQCFAQTVVVYKMWSACGRSERSRVYRSSAGDSQEALFVVGDAGRVVSASRVQLSRGSWRWSSSRRLSPTTRRSATTGADAERSSYGRRRRLTAAEAVDGGWAEAGAEERQ